MLNLRLENGARLDIPPHSVIVLEETNEGTKGQILYDVGNGPQHDVLDDNYGYVRKLLIDSGFHPNLIEVNIVRKDAKDGSVRLTLRDSMIVARRELIDDESEAKCAITVKMVEGQTIILHVRESRDELAGEA